MANNRDRKSFTSPRKNSKICSDDRHRWRFCSVFRRFGTHFSESFSMSKSSGMMDPTRSREMPSCSANYLAQMRRSSKVSSSIWSITTVVDTVLGHPGRGATHVENYHFLTGPLDFDGGIRCACSTHVSVRMARISFGAFPCRKKRIQDSYYLHVFKIARVPWNASFSLCKKKWLVIRHTKKPLFPTTLSISLYDKGKLVGLRNYQNPLLLRIFTPDEE